MIYFFIGDSNYILHLHIHNPFTRNKYLNRTIDLMLASVTGMTASNWKIQHLHGHHLGKDILFNGSKDWEVEKYSPLRALSYCFRSMWYTFWRPFVISLRNGLKNKKQPINYRWALTEHLLLFALIALLLVFNTKIFLTYILPLYALTFFITRYVDYLNHYGCDETSSNVYEHSNNCLNPSFNRFTHNFGYHTAHHLKPGAHWTQLPSLYEEVADKIPDHCKKDYSWSWVLIPYHFYLSQVGKM
ncbi:fatty acid desaturase [Roseibium algae]|uniref:fatty acid desaturase n=1 Tax=Roseibium algae TaxID=3123038 RepID=UPI003BF50835